MQATYLFLFSIILGKFCLNLHCNRLYFYHPLLHRSNTDATSLNIHTRHNVSNIILFHSSASFGISLLLFVLSCTLHSPYISYFRNPFTICSSASFSDSPSVISLISCSPAIFQLLPHESMLHRYHLLQETELPPPFHCP